MTEGNRFALGPREVHVWLAEPTRLHERAAALDYLRVLDEYEQTQYRKFYFERDRHTYLVAHAMVRDLLSRYCPEVRPAAWSFVRNEYGRPDIAAGLSEKPLRVNLSHTRGLVACAIAWNRELGVDVEYMQDRTDPVAVADRFFAPSEVDTLLRLPARQHRDRFFRYWTLKESYIKARGMGLALPLRRFAFDVDGNGDNAITITFSPEFDDQPSSWHFYQQRVGNQYYLAVSARKDQADDTPLAVSVGSIIPFAEAKPFFRVSSPG